MLLPRRESQHGTENAKCHFLCRKTFTKLGLQQKEKGKCSGARSKQRQAQIKYHKIKCEISKTTSEQFFRFKEKWCLKISIEIHKIQLLGSPFGSVLNS